MTRIDNDSYDIDRSIEWICFVTFTCSWCNKQQPLECVSEAETESKVLLRWISFASPASPMSKANKYLARLLSAYSITIEPSSLDLVNNSRTPVK